MLNIRSIGTIKRTPASKDALSSPAALQLPLNFREIFAKVKFKNYDDFFKETGENEYWVRIASPNIVYDLKGIPYFLAARSDKIDQEYGVVTTSNSVTLTTRASG